MQRGLVLLTMIWVVTSLPHAVAAELPGPTGPERGPLRKQSWLLPSPDFSVMMQTTLFRPAGAGPFPLVVVSHGSSEVAEDRAAYDSVNFDQLAAWFVEQGYAVVAPQRVGYGKTGGVYQESIESCAFPKYREAAQAAAASIESTVLFMMGYPFIRKTPVVLVGQSSGSLASLAVAALWPRMAGAAMLFAAGNGGRHSNRANETCAPERLIATIKELGAQIRIPTLWLYAENDTYFGPDLSRQIVQAFRDAGGNAEYHLVQSISGDGHFLIHSSQAAPLWQSIAKKFLHGVR